MMESNYFSTSNKLILLLLVLQHSTIYSFSNEANVAVLDCSKKYPNVYYDLERKEWSVHSADSKCFSSEKELLDLCKIVYPKLNIVNIMKSDEPVKFTVYGCTNGDRLSNNNNNNNVLTLSNSKLKNCSKLKIKSVFPYKCLHGEFQSSELFIPPKCQFQHLYSNDVCQSQEYWKILSKTKCESSNSNLNTSMLLQWCDASTSGVAMFSGIEFVCCPLNDDSVNSNPQINEEEDIDDDGDDDDDENEEENDDDEAALDEDQDTESITSVDNLDDYNLITPIKSNKIINQKDELSLDDLKNAVNKLNNLEQNQLESVEGTQEQKNEYEKQKQLIINSIQFSIKNLIKEKNDLNVDEKAAKLLDPQFDIRYNRLKAEKDRLLIQEETAYEQQVQGRLNELKLNSIKDLNQIMQDESELNKQNLDLIVKYLSNFLLAQENDRLHMVTVYKKLKAYFSNELTERAVSIKNHFESIDNTINQTISIFVKKFGSNAVIIVDLLNDKLKQYESVRRDADSIKIELKQLKLVTKKPYIKTDLTDTDEENNKEQQVIDDIIDNDEQDSTESSELPEIKSNKKSVDIKLIKSNSSLPFIVIGICLGILLSAILIFSIIKRKQIQSRQAIKQGFLPVEQSNPEDQQISNMQLNGYENPTYKFFETNNLQV